MNLLMISGDTSVARHESGAFYEMLRRFSSYWEQIDIITPHAGASPRDRVHDNVYLHPSPWPKWRQPQFIIQHGQALMTHRPYHLITSHDFGFFYNGLGSMRLARQTGTPVVSELHHIEGYPRAATRKEQLYRLAADMYVRWVKDRVAAFRVVNQHEVPTYLTARGVPPDRTLYLPSLYIDFDLFAPQSVEKTTDLLFVGRLVANKGLAILLDGFERLRALRSDATLTLLGRGPLEGWLHDQINQRGLSGAVTHIPRLESAANVATLYNRARMLVCSSTNEGGPRVTVEAMACGVPVISTPVGVMPDIIQHGENGYLFDWNPAELATLAADLLADPTEQSRIGQAGCEAVQVFEADRVIRQYAEGYHQLIRDQGATP